MALQTKTQPNTQPTMDLADVRDAFEGVVDAVARGEGNVVVARDGVPAAAIISMRELARFERYLSQREARFAVIEELREAFRGVPQEEIERETDRILERIRAERRAEATAPAAV